MCGICGIFNYRNDVPIDEAVLKKMADTLLHRGPDDEGMYLGYRNKIGLAHRRLSIIDLETGHQPIHNEDKSIWIVFNGEIYNFPELKLELEKKGHKFYTKTDTEVIVHLYEESGINCLDKLRGMFAFGLWDEHNRQLILARDHVGRKPLSYMMLDGKLIFGSEIKAMLTYPQVKREVNFEAIHYYLTYQYIPSPLTAFKDIYKLPPASYLICDEKGNVKIERYWHLSYNKKSNWKEDEYCLRIKEMLRESTKIRLISDVPLGAFLSGGIDSSAVVGMMAKCSSTPVKTFAIGFEEKDFSELNYSRIVSKHFSTEHHEFIVKPKAMEILPKLIWHYNEPYADVSAIPSYYVASQTRKYVTVALNGDGGDENFAGYDRYKAHMLVHYYHYKKLPDFLRKKLFPKIVNLLPESTKRNDFFRRLKRFVNASSVSDYQRNYSLLTIFDEKQLEDIYTLEFFNKIKIINLYNYLEVRYLESGSKDLLDQLQYTDFMTYLPEDLLVKMDIATMANSLEARSPFLDHKLIEFVAQIPSHLKLGKRLTSKYILKRALKDFLPAEILNRPKMGFGVPIGKWFREELKDYMKEILLSSKTLSRNYFKEPKVTQLINDHISGKKDNGYRLWTLLNLELWHRMFIDNYTEQL